MHLIDPDELAACNIWAEAEGESYLGKVCVGEVMRERMRRKYSSDGTVAGTVAKRKQFSAWNDDRDNNDRLILALNLDKDDPIVQQCFNAWLESKHTNHTKGAVLYCNKEQLVKEGNLPSWARQDKLLLIVKNHWFYKD